MARPLLCVIDVDGTLLTSRHELSDATRKAVDHARANGIQIMLASSRGPAALVPVLDRIEATDGDVFVASQGAVTARRSAHTGGLVTVRSRPAPLTAARSLVRTALAHDIAVSWFRGMDWFVSHVDDHVRREAEVVGIGPRVCDLLQFRGRPEKLMLISDAAVLGAISDDLPDGLQAQASNPGYLEVTATGVDKATAVANYCRLNHIPPERVVAIGDGPNDLTLFAFAGRSIAPANAPPAVRAHADEVTASNDEDGVAEALRRLAGQRRF